LNGIVSKRLGDEFSKEEANEEYEDPNDFENKPEWLSLFPKDRTKTELIREYPDYANLPPEDPLFLDMPFPTEAGPEASAFGRHMQWKRRLSDGESESHLIQNY
jgi:hypothetical protein